MLLVYFDKAFLSVWDKKKGLRRLDVFERTYVKRWHEVVPSGHLINATYLFLQSSASK